LKVTMRDGSVMTGTARMGKITLVTDYGKLEIPLKNVSAIDVGIPSDEANKNKIIGLVKQLAGTEENMRKNAYEEIQKLDVTAIPIIHEFLNSGSYQPGSSMDYTPESALSELMAKYEVEDGFSTKDVIALDFAYTMGGTYDFKKIDLKTAYGSLSLPKEKIRHIDILYTGGSEGGDMVFTLFASKHISGNTQGGWYKTGIQVKNGQHISMYATGQVTLASLSNGKYSPDGAVKGGEGEGYEGEYEGGSGSYPTYGQLVYKVGESGTMTKAGAKFSGTMYQNGMLYLSIYETVYNAANTGTYNVKVVLK
jgi:hypothetical protein